MGGKGRGGRQDLLPLPGLLPGGSPPARIQLSRGLLGDILVLPTAVKAATPCVDTKGTFWETTAGFAFFSLFHLNFLPPRGTHWASRCRNAHPPGVHRRQPSPRWHWRGFGPEHHQQLIWKDPTASLELKRAPASPWFLEPSPSHRCLRNISDAVRKRVAKRQRRGLASAVPKACGTFMPSRAPPEVISPFLGNIH